MALVVKAKYNTSLRRFNVLPMEDGSLDLSLAGLRSKICELFQFNPSTQFVITYVDEDNDIVTMADDNDLLDVLNQGLNPLRLEVSLMSQNNRATEKQAQSQPSTPRNFSIPKEQGQAFDLRSICSEETLKVLPEPLRKAILKCTKETANLASTTAVADKSPMLLQSNPVHKKIPVLLHNGKPVCESMIIVQYIEETWDTKASNLVPKDPYDRAIARFWVAFVDDKVGPSIRGIFTGRRDEQRKAVEESVGNFLWLEEALRTSGKAYFGGDEIGLVDIALGSLSQWIKVLRKAAIVLIEPEKMPLLSAWMERFFEADGVKQVLPDEGKMLEFASAMRTRFAVAPAGN